MVDSRNPTEPEEALPARPDNTRPEVERSELPICPCLAVVQAGSDAPSLLGRRFRLAFTPVRVGRLWSNDVVCASDRISRHHAELVKIDDRWLVRDSASLHGTFVNGARVVEAKLAAGDRIRVGDVVFEFLDDDALNAKPYLAAVDRGSKSNPPVSGAPDPAQPMNPKNSSKTQPEDADQATAVHVVKRILTELQRHDGDTGKYASALAREITDGRSDSELAGCTDGDLIRLIATRRMRSVDAALYYGLNRLDQRDPWPEEGMSYMVLGTLLSTRDRLAEAAARNRSSNKFGCPHDLAPLVAGKTVWLCDACGSAVCPRCRALFVAHWPVDGGLPWWSLNCECMEAVASEFDLLPPNIWTDKDDIVHAPPPVRASVVAPGDPLARWIPGADSGYDGSVRAVLIRTPGVTGARMSWVERWDSFLETLVAREMNAMEMCTLLEVLDRLYLYCMDRGLSGQSSDQVTFGCTTPVGIPEGLRKISLGLRKDVETHFGEFAELHRKQSREWKRFWADVRSVRPLAPAP